MIEDNAKLKEILSSEVGKLYKSTMEFYAAGEIVPKDEFLIVVGFLITPIKRMEKPCLNASLLLLSPEHLYQYYVGVEEETSEVIVCNMELLVK
jgi:hypothetical protein